MRNIAYNMGKMVRAVDFPRLSFNVHHMLTENIHTKYVLLLHFVDFASCTVSFQFVPGDSANKYGFRFYRCSSQYFYHGLLIKRLIFNHRMRGG